MYVHVHVPMVGAPTYLCARMRSFIFRSQESRNYKMKPSAAAIPSPAISRLRGDSNAFGADFSPVCDNDIDLELASWRKRLRGSVRTFRSPPKAGLVKKNVAMLPPCDWLEEWVRGFTGSDCVAASLVTKRAIIDTRASAFVSRNKQRRKLMATRHSSRRKLRHYRAKKQCQKVTEIQSN